MAEKPKDRIKVHVKPAAPTPEKRRQARKVIARHRTGPAGDEDYFDQEEELEGMELDGTGLGVSAVKSIKLSYQVDQYQKWYRRRLVQGLAVALVLILAGSFYALLKHQRTKYLTKVRTTRDSMRSAVNECLALSDEYLAVWKTAIYGGEDPDLALRAKHGNFAKNAVLLRLDSRKELLESAMKEISDPPSEYEKAHVKIVELFDMYVELHTLSKFPSGTRESYERTVHDLNDRYMDTADELDALLPK